MVTAETRGGGGGGGEKERKCYSWSRVYACLGWVLDLILSTLSREVNVALLYRRYFEKEPMLRLYLNFYDY